MKKIKFLVATMLMAIVPMLFNSWEEKPEQAPEPTIDGTWECMEAILKYDGGGEDLDSYKGQTWKFDELNILTIGDKTYDYTLSNNTLTTSYAALYETDYFQVDTLTSENLILSASYVEETKVGDIDITVILTFKRLSE